MIEFLSVWSASRPRSANNSSTSRSDSENRRYQRTAQRITSGAVCRHLNIAGRVAFFTIFADYQPIQPKLQHLRPNCVGSSEPLLFGAWDVPERRSGRYGASS